MLCYIWWNKSGRWRNPTMKKSSFTTLVRLVLALMVPGLLLVCAPAANAQDSFAGIWRAGNDGHYLWVGDNWDSFNAKWEELAKQNLRLTVVKTYMDGGQRKYLGVWRAGSDGHYLWAGVDWNN